MPRLDDEIGVEDGVHLHSDVGGDGDNGSEIENPADVVEEAGVEAEEAAVAGSGGEGGPVVDAAGGGDAGCELLSPSILGLFSFSFALSLHNYEGRLRGYIPRRWRRR